MVSKRKLEQLKKELKNKINTDPYRNISDKKLNRLNELIDAEKAGNISEAEAAELEEGFKSLPEPGETKEGRELMRLSDKELKAEGEKYGIKV